LGKAKTEIKKEIENKWIEEVKRKGKTFGKSVYEKTLRSKKIV